MGLNIKNERVHSLAREAARRTGQTQTSVIEQALERLLAGLDEAGDARRRRLQDWLDSFEVSDEERAAAHQAMDDLYDAETGLPA